MIYFRRDIQRLQDHWTDEWNRREDEHAKEMNALHARHDAEIERLTKRFDADRDRWRSDRREELERLANPQGEFVAHLLKTIEYERAYSLAERQRADVSIDQRLAERGLGPATVPPRPITLEQQAQAHREMSPMGALFPSLAGMGDPAGVPE